MPKQESPLQDKSWHELIEELGTPGSSYVSSANERLGECMRRQCVAIDRFNRNSAALSRCMMFLAFGMLLAVGIQV